MIIYYLYTLYMQFNWTKNIEFYGTLGNFTFNPSDKVGLLASNTFIQGLNNLIRDTDSR